MGHVNQIARNRWEVRVELGRDPLTGKRKRIIRHVNGNKKDAEQKLAEITRQVETGAYVEPSRLTVGDYLTRWLRHMHGQLAPSAYGRYEAIVTSHIIPILGHVLMQKLRPEHIVDAEAHWLKAGRLHRGTGLSAKTVLNHHRVLHKALQDAVLVFHVLQTNPVDSVPAPRWEKRRPQRLTADEALRLMDVLDDDDAGPLILTMLYTGMRAGEVLGLRWREDVDLERRHMAVQQQWDRYAKAFRETKSHRSTRPVSIDADLAAVLERWRVRQIEWQLQAGPVWTPSGLVFTTRTGEHLTHDRVRRALQRVLAAAGLQSVSPHALRHSHATLMIAAGTHMRVLQERLGHASFAITADLYGAVAPGLQAEAAEQFAESLRRRRRVST